MMEVWPAALEASTLARALRGSVWAYPLVNAGHLLGVALLIGAIVPLDLRILGVWPTVPLPPLWRVLTRMAAIGLGLAGVCGALLFMTRAAAYAGEGFFVAKMIVVATEIVTAIISLWNTFPSLMTPDFPSKMQFLRQAPAPGPGGLL